MRQLREEPGRLDLLSGSDESSRYGFAPVADLGTAPRSGRSGNGRRGSQNREGALLESVALHFCLDSEVMSSCPGSQPWHEASVVRAVRKIRYCDVSLEGRGAIAMVAYNLKDVRDAFADEKIAASFARQFMEAYLATAFGALPKSEIDLLVFSTLVRLDIIEINRATYRIARALNITPAKARALLFQHQLRNVSEDETDHQIMIAITTARYWKDGDKLSFGISSPLVKAAVSAKMEERGVFADVSLSGNILRVDPGRFGAVLASLVSHAQASRVIDVLKDKRIVDDSTLRATLEKRGSDLASKLFDKATEKGAQKAFDALMIGLATVTGGPVAGGAVAVGIAATRAFGDALFE